MKFKATLWDNSIEFGELKQVTILLVNQGFQLMNLYVN